MTRIPNKNKDSVEFEKNFCNALEGFAQALRTRKGQAAIRAERQRIADERLRQLGMKE